MKFRGFGLCLPGRQTGVRGWAAVFIIIVMLFSANLSYAHANVESLAEVENLFMEAKYERVVTEAGKLIDSGAYGREELNYLKGLSLVQLSRFNEARQTFAYLVERYPSGKRAFDGYTGIGDSYFLEGKYNEAIAAYNDALQRFPGNKNSAAVYYKTGNAYQKLGMADKADEYFSKVKKTSPLSFESNMISKDATVTPVVSTAAPVKEESLSDAGDYYYVQAGYFKTKANADKLNEKLHQKGYDSCIAELFKSNALFYRVKVGRFKTRAEAEAMANKLKKDRFMTKVCR